MDFGTSNTAAGVIIDGRSHLIKIENEDETLPTSIFYDSASKTVRFGRDANRSLIEGDEGRFMRALKSVLGTSLMHEKRYLQGQNITFVDVIARFIREVKERSETEMQQSFDYALSGRPVFFHSNNNEKDKQALDDLTKCYLKAGFKGVEFFFEPEAAALASGVLKNNEIALIVDIGGGTSDFCLFRACENRIEVLANNGVRIGGTNFDRSLSIDHVMPLLGHKEQIKMEMGAGTLTAPKTIFTELATWERIPSLYTPDNRRFASKLHKLAVNKRPFARLEKVLELEFGHDIAFASERAKIDTNRIGFANIELGFVERELDIPLSSETLNQSLQSHAQDIANSTLETLKLAQCSPEKIDKVIFVGGSSLMNVVDAAVAPLFPSAELHYSDAFTAIVDGLALASEKYAR
ncbi:MAG: Hsp70 family protein [Hyphomicrobiales bacterium]